MGKKLNIEIGTKFGKWTVVSTKTLYKNNLTHWECKCECGRNEFVPLNNLMNGSSTQCKNCASKQSGEKRRKGHKEISGDMWSQIKNNATKKGFEFDIRIEEAWKLFIKQEKRCFLSNRKLKFSGYPYVREKTTAVLSRIDKNMKFSYINCIWVHKDVEKMRGDMDLDVFLSLVDDIYENK